MLQAYPVVTKVEDLGNIKKTDRDSNIDLPCPGQKRDRCTSELTYSIPSVHEIFIIIKSSSTITDSSHLLPTGSEELSTKALDLQCALGMSWHSTSSAKQTKEGLWHPRLYTPSARGQPGISLLFFSKGETIAQCTQATSN